MSTQKNVKPPTNVPPAGGPGGSDSSTNDGPKKRPAKKGKQPKDGVAPTTTPTPPPPASTPTPVPTTPVTDGAVPPAAPTAAPKGNKPPPQVSGPPKSSDPLDVAEMVLPSLEGLHLRPQCLRHCNDYTGYISLVETVWETLSSLSPFFSRNVSLSMFTYYCVIALWKRFYSILEAQGKDNLQVNMQFNAALNCNMMLPKPLSTWLAGIGDVIDPSRRAFEWTLPTMPTLDNYHGITGYFQRVTSHTYNNYMTIPSPGVALQSMLEDLFIQERNNPDWLLPAPLTHLLAAQALNKNLLGWKTATAMPTEANDTLRALGYRYDAAQVQFSSGNAINIEGISIKSEFIKHVSLRISQLSTSYPMVETLPIGRIGSNAQVGKVQVNFEPQHDPLIRRVDQDAVLGQAYHQLPTTVANAVAILHYKIHRPRTRAVLPIRFQAPAPAAWLNRVNANLVNYDNERWNSSAFVLPEVNGRDLMNEYASKFAK